MPYSMQDLVDAYRRVGVERGGLIYVTSDMLRVADFEQPGSRPLMDAHFRALQEVLGPEGTMVVPTRSMQLCNTDQVFDLDKTPSVGIGAFSEYVRMLPGTLRSFHPFNSYAANGPLAAALTQAVSRSAYGMETPEARMIERKALCVLIGTEPSISCSTIHHVEVVMSVPYRYTKEFMHPVVRNGKVVMEPFYMYCWYRNIGVVCDRNRTLFKRFGTDLEIRQEPIGRGFLKSYSIESFFRLSCKVLSKDIYTWCVREPEIRPYRT